MLTAQHLPAQACVPGTHKSNLRGPPSLYTYEEHQDLVHQEVCKAGDGTALLLAQTSPCAKAPERVKLLWWWAVMIFTEALTHGTIPWSAPWQRRTLLYRYSPANSAFGGGRHDFDRDHRAGNAWPCAPHRPLLRLRLRFVQVLLDIGPVLRAGTTGTRGSPTPSAPCSSRRTHQEHSGRSWKTMAS